MTKVVATFERKRPTFILESVGLISVNGDSLLKLWNRARALPLGARIYSQVLGWMIPYTGSASPRVKVLERGHAIVRLEDTRAVRNHLSSIHAIALANVGEFSTGLALMSQVPEGMRAILRSLKIDYLKKARGTLRAEARCEALKKDERAERVIVGEVLDEQGDCVARIEATWLVGPENPPGKDS